jgi:hypothetical protein
MSPTTVWRHRRAGRFVKSDLGNTRDITGRRFSALRVRCCSGEKNSLGEFLWICDCDCGRQLKVSGYNLRAKLVRHCGCGRAGPMPVAKPVGVDVGELTAQRWAAILRGAKRRNLEMPLTQQEAWNLFEKQLCTCALTGRVLVLEAAALDFHPHPPRWIHRDVSKLLKLQPEPALLQLTRELVAFEAWRAIPQRSSSSGQSHRAGYGEA